MTDPDPHIFVLSRRARRDAGGRTTQDAAPKPAAGATRRAFREPVIAPRHVEPVAAQTRRALRPQLAERVERVDAASALAGSTGRPASPRSGDTALAPRRSTAHPVHRATVVQPSMNPPGTASRPFLARSGSEQAAGSSHPHPTDERSTPIWEAVTHRPVAAPATVAGEAPESHGASEALSRAPAAQTGTQSVSDTALSSAVVGWTTSSAAVVEFVMPQARAIRTGVAPPIFRARPPKVHTALEPLLPASAPARHARRRSRTPMRLGMAATAAAVTAALVLGGSVGVTAAVTGTPVSTIARNVVVAVAAIEPSTPAPIRAAVTSPPPVSAPAPAPSPEATPAPAAVDPCTTPGTVAALQAGDDAAVVAALGGAEALRAAVASGGAACVDLGDPARAWVVLGKTRPLDPIDYAPTSLTMPEGVRSLEGGELRADAAAAMSAMVSAAGQAGVGEVALQSAYRSYDTQVTSYGNQVSERGAEGAELVSARPGHSEHQSGLAADIVPCDGECGTLDDLAASVQGQWVAAHSWEYGWIVRYEAGHTGVTGYSPEPWHLRYIGVDLATAYHAGGWHTLEEFFGLPPAPDYLD